MQPLVIESNNGLVPSSPLSGLDKYEPTVFFHNQGLHTNFLVHNLHGAHFFTGTNQHYLVQHQHVLNTLMLMRRSWNMEVKLGSNVDALHAGAT